MAISDRELSAHAEALNVPAHRFLIFEEELLLFTAISRFETGQCNPTLDLLVKMAECMDLEIKIELVDKSKEKGDDHFFTSLAFNTM